MMTKMMTRRQKEAFPKNVAIGTAVVAGGIAVANKRLPMWARVGLGLGIGLVAVGTLMDMAKQGQRR